MLYMDERTEVPDPFDPAAMEVRARRLRRSDGCALRIGAAKAHHAEVCNIGTVRDFNAGLGSYCACPINRPPNSCGQPDTPARVSIFGQHRRGAPVTSFHAACGNLSCINQAGLSA